MLRTLVTVILFIPSITLAESYGECRGRLTEAYQANEFEQMEAVAKQCLEIRPNYPGMLFNLAMAQTLAEKPSAAIQTLTDLVERELFYQITIEPFDQLEKTDAPAYKELVLRFDALRDSRGTADIAFTYQEKDFVPEGIAYDERDGSLYLGSIRNSKIVRLEENGKHTPFATTFQWSVFGMRIDPKREELWVATAAVPQGKNTPPQELGETQILRFKLRDGSLLRRYRLPRHDDQQQVLGDLILSKSGIYTTDSLTGAVYKLSTVSGKYTTIIPPGILTSPQGLVESVDGNYLYIADYRGGLIRLNLGNYDLEKVNATSNFVLYGIDGLYRHGDDLIAIQNGIAPHRVTRISLNESGDTVTSTAILAMGLAEFDEPTLGQVVGDQFLFVANSHWNRFNADNELELDPNDLLDPIVLSIKLP